MKKTGAPFLKDLLHTDIRFDMNIHILCFQLGGCHPFVETHIKERGAYILSKQTSKCYIEDFRFI